jgi:hypothetical protein
MNNTKKVFLLGLVLGVLTSISCLQNLSGLIFRSDIIVVTVVIVVVTLVWAVIKRRPFWIALPLGLCIGTMLNLVLF